MKAVNAAGAARRPGRHWVFTAVVMPLNPLAWWAQVVYGNRWESCVTDHPGAKDQAFAGPCGGSYTVVLFALLALLALTAAIAIGFFIGISEGRHRRRFAYGRWVCAVVIGLSSPPAMLLYALGYGLGRLLPAPRPDPLAAAHQEGWRSAVNLYAALVAGQPPQQVLAPGFFTTEPLHLDTTMTYARYYGMDVTFQPGATFPLGSPGFVAGAAIGNLIGNSIGRSQAAETARTQWREHRTVRVVVTARTTWCCVDGRWLSFDHSAVMEYHLNGPHCVMTFAGVEPLGLAGPAAAVHAVLFAYLRGGHGWQHAPFLHPVAADAARLQDFPAPAS